MCDNWQQFEVNSPDRTQTVCCNIGNPLYDGPEHSINRTISDHATWDPEQGIKCWSIGDPTIVDELRGVAQRLRNANIPTDDNHVLRCTWFKDEPIPGSTTGVIWAPHRRHCPVGVDKDGGVHVGCLRHKSDNRCCWFDRDLKDLHCK